MKQENVVGFYDVENKDIRLEIPMGEDGDWWQPVYTHKQNEWIKLVRGVRVEGDTVIVSVKGGNDAARELCNELIKEINK